MIIDTLKFKVMGYMNKTVKKEDKEIEYTQLQNYELINGVLKKHTLKVNRLLNEKELEDTMNKVIIVKKEDGLNEFGEFDKVYVCNDYTITNEIISDNRVLETSLTIKLSNFKINKEKNNTLIQYVDTADNNIQILDIKIKELLFDFSKYINETFVIKNISTYQDKTTKKKYYSTTTKPQHIKG